MRKIALTATMAVALLAMSAVSASAATQVRDRTGTLCPAVSPALNAGNVGLNSQTRSYASGGCTVRMSTPQGAALQFRIYRSANNTNDTDCSVAFDAHIGGDGWGYAENFVYSNCAGGAGVTSCPGDRYIAPRSFTGVMFAPFNSATAATDLHMEMCASSLGNYWWGRNSFDITYPTTSLWMWTNQLTTANMSDPSQHFRNGTLYNSTPGNYLTITH